MNLVDLLGKLSAAMNNPFAIHWTEYSARCLLFFTMGYGIVALTVASSRKNRRRGVEHGSAQWGDVFQIAKRYRDKKHPKENLILTQHFQMGLDGHNPLVAVQQFLDVVQDGAAVGVAADQVGLHQLGGGLGEGLGIAAGQDGDGAGIFPLGLTQPFAAFLVAEVGDGAAVYNIDVGGLAVRHHGKAAALEQLFQGLGLVQIDLAAKGIKTNAHGSSFPVWAPRGPG